MNCLVAWLDSACFSRLLDLKRGLKLRATKNQPVQPNYNPTIIGHSKSAAAAPP
jgi:hypothetical protein